MSKDKTFWLSKRLIKSSWRQGLMTIPWLQGFTFLDVKEKNSWQKSLQSTVQISMGNYSAIQIWGLQILFQFSWIFLAVKESLNCFSMLVFAHRFSLWPWCPLTDSEVKNPNFDFQFFLADFLPKKSRNLKNLARWSLLKSPVVTIQNSPHDVLYQILKSKIQNLIFSFSLQISCRKVKGS